MLKGLCWFNCGIKTAEVQSQSEELISFLIAYIYIYMCVYICMYIYMYIYVFH